MPVTQLKFDNIKEATTAAIQMSKESGYAAIILSNDKENLGHLTDKYYVEDSAPFVRNWETLIGEYENGIKNKQD